MPDPQVRLGRSFSSGSNVSVNWFDVCVDLKRVTLAVDALNTAIPTQTIAHHDKRRRSFIIRFGR